MLLRYCVFTFILTKLGCFGAQWPVLENFKQVYRQYSKTAEEVIKVIDDFILLKKYDALDFLYNIDRTPYLERNELRPYCSAVHHDLEYILLSFKTDMVKLEAPLLGIRLEIKERLSDIGSTIDIYQRLAETKHQNCRDGEDYACEERILTWLIDKVDKLQCRVTAICGEEMKSVRVQRSVSECENCTTEEPYSAANCSVEHGSFLCSNKRCVPLAEICDGKDDCGDSSDEGPLCRGDTECRDGCTASGGVCFPGPEGSLCLDECPDGTVDEGGTCRPGPQRVPDSLEGLFERVPYLFERYVGAIASLKKRLLSSLENAFLSCQGTPGQLRALGQIPHRSLSK